MYEARELKPTLLISSTSKKIFRLRPRVIFFRPLATTSSVVAAASPLFIIYVCVYSFSHIVHKAVETLREKGQLQLAYGRKRRENILRGEGEEEEEARSFFLPHSHKRRTFIQGFFPFLHTLIPDPFKAPIFLCH